MPARFEGGTDDFYGQKTLRTALFRRVTSGIIPTAARQAASGPRYGLHSTPCAVAKSEQLPGGFHRVLRADIVRNVSAAAWIENGGAETGSSK